MLPAAPEMFEKSDPFWQAPDGTPNPAVQVVEPWLGQYAATIPTVMFEPVQMDCIGKAASKPSVLSFI